MYTIELNQFMLDNLDGREREEYLQSEKSWETLCKFFPEAYTNIIRETLYNFIENMNLIQDKWYRIEGDVEKFYEGKRYRIPGVVEARCIGKIRKGRFLSGAYLLDEKLVFIHMGRLLMIRERDCVKIEK